MEPSLDTPVALLVFNRPETTRRVFEVIRQVRPRRLLIVADGPRSDNPDDPEKVAETRKICEGVDWPCEVLKNYSDSNLGCRERIASGLDWVFEDSPEAIVLEDDCLPLPSFFRYCEQLLERYRDEERVMAINGFCGVNPPESPYSYFFSGHIGCWGWASWRRAWRHFDIGMKSWPTFRDAGLIRTLVDSPAEAEYYTATFDSTYQGLNDSWGYAWLFACWSRNGLSAISTVNLIQNIGFGEGATHTTGKDHSIRTTALQGVEPLKHPPFVIRDPKADRAVFRLEEGLIEGDSAERDTECTSWHIRHLEEQVLECLSELRAKEDVIQQLVRGSENGEWVRERKELADQVCAQAEELRAKEDVIQMLLSQRDELPPTRTQPSLRALLRKTLSSRWVDGLRSSDESDADLPIHSARRIILGAADSTYPGWFATDRDSLDVTRPDQFAKYWRPASRDAFLAEHVWEHLDDKDAGTALDNCFRFLKPGGRLRLAVPDAFHPDPGYHQQVRPGGTGPGADDHKAFYSYKSLGEKLTGAGFEVHLLEHWDESGRFHFHPWSWNDGPVQRSSRHDSRNLDWPNAYTSLIIDGIKP